MHADRILAISDIHGQNKKFLLLLKKAEYNPDHDLLVVCGDMIDRGTENLATVNTCIELKKKGAIILKGNHEQFAQECIKDMLLERPSMDLRLWVNHNGGSNTYDELLALSKSQLKNLQNFFSTLPLYFAKDHYIFTHAAANTTKPIEKNTENETVWSKDTFYYRPAYKDKIMIFGHKPTWLLRPSSKNNTPENATIWFDINFNDKIGIDCGSIFGGKLAALELPGMREFYV
ncbi:MAG: metallophosphoesterase [Firmicutes bacterium]|nr:metallophosphoesterase [Bacillota bacterium]